VRAGWALFNTPQLLGGQATKASLNCASCHVNGRNNPHFLLPGLSGGAGTADVTSSFFSAARGNAVHDPVRIPDLAEPGKISRDRAARALEQFIRDLVVEEFSGNEPGASALAALSAYVRAIRLCADGGAVLQNRRLQDQVDLIDAALDGAIFLQQRGDPATAKLLIAGARYQLGLIDERYARPGFAKNRRLLLGASRRLATISASEDHAGVANALTQWRKDFNARLLPRLVAGEPRSLYNEDQIVAALGRKAAPGK
jgi:hypothetical protein